MSGSSHANKPTTSSPPPFVGAVVDSLVDALYDVNDPTTAIGGHIDPSAARAAHAHLTDDEQVGTDVAPRLQVSLEDIEFSQTRVGRRATRSVVVTNTDPIRTIEIDGIDLADNGLGNFEVHGASTLLEPRQSVTFHISYVPTNSGEHTARVRLFEGAGMSTPFIELRGSATETEGQRRERVEEMKVEIGDTKNLPTNHPVERKHANEAILDWKDRVKDLIRATSTWTTGNWTRFLSETGGDFRVSWTEGHVSDVVGDYLSGVAGMLSSNPIVEFVASTFTSLIYDAIFTHQGNRENEQAVFDGIKKTGNEIEKKQLDVARVEAEAVSMAEAQATTAEHKVQTATDVKEIGHVLQWAQREAASVPTKINTSDRSLYKQLLQSWVLERSATASTSTESTNRPAFEAARENAFGLKNGQDIARADLFVFQARHEWSTLGIANVPEIEARLVGQVNALVRQAHAASLEGPEVASYVSNMIGQPLRIDLVPASLEQTRLAMEGAGIPLPQRDFMKHRLECLVTLGVDGSSVTTKFFNYYLGRHVGTRTP